MTLLEKKVDAIAMALLASDFPEKNAALVDLKRLLDQPEQKSKDVDSVIRDALLDLGVPDHILGHRYLVTALAIVVKDHTAADAITGHLYPTVAKQHDTTGSRVERAIRHAIELAWERADYEILGKYFGNTISSFKGKATNAEFIARVANVVRKRMEDT